MQVMALCKGQKELASGGDPLALPAWRLTNLLQLHDSVLNMHTACCALQPQLKEMDRQLPSGPADTCSLMKLAECLLEDSSSTSGKISTTSTCKFVGWLVVGTVAHRVSSS